MKKANVIYEQGRHRWIMVARDPEKPGYVIDTNEYLVMSNEHALLMDPGGSEIFPSVFSALIEVLDPRTIGYIFASHQDPDIISSMALWLQMNPQLKCYISWLWSGFIPHFGCTDQSLISLPDEGLEIDLGMLTLQAVPAHHLHSAGNFHLYDQEAAILFSGDVGAALLPQDQQEIFVTDFDRHIQHAKAFHQRWMGSAAAKQEWCERVAAMKIDMLCPQHGAVYQGPDVERFINWFAELELTGVVAPGQ